MPSHQLPLALATDHAIVCLFSANFPSNLILTLGLGLGRLVQNLIGLEPGLGMGLELVEHLLGLLSLGSVGAAIKRLDDIVKQRHVKRPVAKH